MEALKYLAKLAVAFMTFPLVVGAVSVALFVYLVNVGAVDHPLAASVLVLLFLLIMASAVIGNGVAVLLFCRRIRGWSFSAAWCASFTAAAAAILSSFVVLPHLASAEAICGALSGAMYGVPLLVYFLAGKCDSARKEGAERRGG